MKIALIHVLFLLFEICVFGDADIVVTVSVIEGESVTLHTDVGVTEIRRSDAIDWRLNGKRIAKISGDNSSTDGIFRDGLKLDKQTGDLKIKNIKTTDSGEYKLKITRTRGSSEKTFNVSVSADTVTPLSMLVGDSVTLNTYLHLNQTQIYDVVQWRFEDLNSTIAEINRAAGIFSPYNDVSDGIFRDTLMLECLTGSLTIKNIGTEHSGVYEVDIGTSRGYTMHKSFSVTVRDGVKSLSVMEGGNFTLKTLTEIQSNDFMLWMFGDTEINKTERFINRLKLDHRTGSLTIMNIRNTDSGEYKLQINNSRDTVHKRFTVTVSGEIKQSVKKGDPVTLNSGLTEIQGDDQMLWMFGNTVIAKRITVYDDVLVGRFRDRLKLDNQTGSLTITNTTTEDKGIYELKINSSRRTVHKRFTVTVIDPGLSPVVKRWIIGGGVGVPLALAAVALVKFYYRRKISELIEKALRTLPVMEGESVTLIPYGTEIQKDDDIEWKFGDATIAERKGPGKKITINDDLLDEKFKGRLHLDTYSGYLTITGIKTTDSGYYELLSSRSGKKSLKTFYVSLFAKREIKKKSKKEGESVTLETGVTDIKKDDEIQWKFGLDDIPIAQITGGTKTISPFSAGWRFIFRLKLDQTGSLTIKRLKLNHTGFYVLYITHGGETSMKLFKVKVSEDNPKVSLNSLAFP